MTAQTPQRRTPPVFRPVLVTRVERLTPRMNRITFGGEALADYKPLGPAGHVRVLLPAPGQEAPAIPTWGPSGPEFPEGQPRPHSRAYTPRLWNDATKELSIDFVLHGNGVASRWAATAKPGDQAVIAGPRTAYKFDPDAKWIMLVADETGLPAIATVLAALPASMTATAIVEVHDAAEEQPLPGADTVKWLHRTTGLPRTGGGNAPQPGGALLEQAVRAAELPAGHGTVWIACEAMAMRRLRHYLLSERGLPAAQLFTRGYWKQGVGNHPDHDTGED